VLSTRYDREDQADHSCGVVNQIAIVDTDDVKPDRLEVKVSAEVSATRRRIGVVRFAVALDEQSVADQQVRAMVITSRDARLRDRGDARICEQNAQDAFRARFGTTISARRHLTRTQCPGSGGAQQAAARQSRSPQR
jgi:hypothetical protein